MAEPVDPAASDMPALKFAEGLAHYMKTSPYFLSSRPSKAQPKIDRYSDKYTVHKSASDRKGKIHAIVTDLSFFPDELHSVYDRERAQKMEKTQAPRQASFMDTIAKLEDLEKRDEDGALKGDDDGIGEEVDGVEGRRKRRNFDGEAEGDDGDGNDDGDDDDGDDDDEVVYEGEELDDETDYNVSYFDNGEDYGGDNDDGEEGPTY